MGLKTIGLKGAFGLTITHLTGLVTRGSFSVPDKNYVMAGTMLSFVLAFQLGGFMSGLALGTNRFRPQPRYGAILFLEGLMLIFATWIMLSNG